MSLPKTTKKRPPQSFTSTPWTDKAIAFILEVTEFRSRAALLTPAMLSLLATVVSSLERGGDETDKLLLARGRDLLREYNRLDPTFMVDRNV